MKWRGEEDEDGDGDGDDDDDDDDPDDVQLYGDDDGDDFPPPRGNSPGRFLSTRELFFLCCFLPVAMTKLLCDLP